MCLGCCYFWNSTSFPSQCVGMWSDGESVHMIIKPHGSLNYIKMVSFQWLTIEKSLNFLKIIQKSGVTFRWNAPVRYSEDGFFGSCCFCCTIEGVYDEKNFQQPKFIVNGDVLTKQVGQESVAVIQPSYDKK